MSYGNSGGRRPCRFPKKEEWISSAHIAKFRSSQGEERARLGEAILTRSPLDYIPPPEWGGPAVGESVTAVTVNVLSQLEGDLFLTWGMLEDARCRMAVLGRFVVERGISVPAAKDIAEATGNCKSVLPQDAYFQSAGRLEEGFFPNQAIYGTLIDQARRRGEPSSIDHLLVEAMTDVIKLSEICFPEEEVLVPALSKRNKPEAVAKILTLRAWILAETRARGERLASLPIQPGIIKQLGE